MLHSPTQPQQIGFSSPIAHRNMVSTIPNHSGSTIVSSYVKYFKLVN